MSAQKTLRLILGDQLNSQHSWFKTPDPSVSCVLMELRSETDYATHHVQKVLGFFAAMRSFAAELKERGHQVLYIKLNATENQKQFDKNISRLIHEHQFMRFEYLLPDEYRVDEHLKQFCEQLTIATGFADTEHFLSSRTDLSQLFEGKKTFLMETFYRHMRKKYKVLMNGTEPLMGQWNFDKDNRKKLPAGHKCTAPLLFENDVTDILDDIQLSGVNTIGSANPKQFLWPVNRLQSLALLQFFTEECLALFGTYEDAMTPEDWSLYHSRLSFSLNTKMLSPLEVIQASINEWEKRPNEISYNQLEGFVRQILGWREYMRGIYWAKMPAFEELNFLQHTAKLPDWYWTGKTKMKCLSHSITQSLDYAYAHHIQRLMVLGNFALLAGTHPDEVDKWFLGIYIDALQWVEITNTRGMSQFADGGIIGSKPYVSSGTYIDKMSHYCKSCFYKNTVKTGEKACPFNSLYWNFYERHQDKLAKNPRIGMMYKVWERMAVDDKTKLLEQAELYLKNINQL